MKHIPIIVALLAAVGLASCSAVRHCKSPELNLPEQVVPGRSDSLTLADLDWWEFYGDTTLCRIIERTLEYNKDLLSAAARVERIEYDPNRSAHIALVLYADGERRYIICPKGLKVGDTIMSGQEAPIKVGNALPLRNIPVGSTIHCIEMLPGKGAQLVRSAGAFAQLIAREGAYAQVRMRSGEVRRILIECRATIGTVGNEENSLRELGKAGATRWRGIRPTVRGKVMNPVDHPHGGGEGKSPVGHPGPMTPWGKPAMGLKTRKTKNRTNKYIFKRRNAK